MGVYPLLFRLTRRWLMRRQDEYWYAYFRDMYFPCVTLVLFAHTVPGMTHDTM